MSNLEYALYSKEVRWFFSEAQYKLDHWFNQNESFFENEAARIDYYFAIQPHDNLSYKIREGRTEIKLRLGESETSVFPNGHKGKIERWVKWSLELKKKIASPDLLYLTDKDNFIGLTKKRKLIKFEILPGKTIRKTSADGFPAEGCQVELTHLHIDKKEWFSFGFEAFGSKSKIDENFNLVTDKVLGEIEGPALKEKDSLSYPEFFASIYF